MIASALGRLTSPSSIDEPAGNQRPAATYCFMLGVVGGEILLHQAIAVGAGPVEDVVRILVDESKFTRMVFSRYSLMDCGNSQRHWVSRWGSRHEGRSGGQIDAMKKQAQVMVDSVFSFGELGFQEFETSKYLTGILEKEGFKIERNYAGIPTAWVASGDRASR
jgi:hypothetical protein